MKFSYYRRNAILKYDKLTLHYRRNAILQYDKNKIGWEMFSHPQFSLDLALQNFICSSRKNISSVTSHPETKQLKVVLPSEHI